MRSPAGQVALICGLLAVGCSEPLPPSGPAGVALTGGSEPVVVRDPGSASALADRVAALELAVHQLRAASAPASASPARPADAPPPGRSTQTVEALEHQAEEQVLAARTAQLHATFMAEPADPRWALSAQAGIRRMLQDNASPGLNAQVDCRSRSCRILVVNAPTDAGLWLQQVATQLTSSFSKVRTHGADDGSALLFVTR